MSAAQLDGEIQISWWGRKIRESLLFATINGIIHNPQGAIAIVGLLLLIVGAVGAPVIAQHDPIAQDAAGRFLSPSVEHWFGTDELRRDLFARTLFGLRASFAVSLISVAIGTGIGVTIGFLAGFIGGWTETAAMRLVDALLAFPGLLAALAILTILGPGVRNIGIAIAFFTIPAFARLSRAQMLAEKNKDYVLASQSMGGQSATPHLPPHRHQRLPAPAHADGVADGGGGAHHRRPQLPGVGRQPPHAVAGRPPQHQPAVPARGLVVRRLPGVGVRPPPLLPEPALGRDQRSFQPLHEATMTAIT